MLSLSFRTPQGGTEAFCGIKILDYVQKLSHFEVVSLLHEKISNFDDF